MRRFYPHTRSFYLMRRNLQGMSDNIRFRIFDCKVNPHEKTRLTGHCQLVFPQGQKSDDGPHAHGPSNRRFHKRALQACIEARGLLRATPMQAIPRKVTERLGVALKKFQPILSASKARDDGEADTVMIVTDMLAELFGYDKYSDVTAEYAIRGTYCDLATKLDGTLQTLVEVKAIGLELKDAHVKQAVDYARTKASIGSCSRTASAGGFTMSFSETYRPRIGDRPRHLQLEFQDYRRSRAALSFL